MDAAPSNWHCSRFKEQESILGFRRRIRSENSSGSSSFSSRSLRAKRRRKPACTASFPSYDGASVHILAISSFTETDHRLSYSSRTGRAQGSLGYISSSRHFSACPVSLFLIFFCTIVRPSATFLYPTSSCLLPGFREFRRPCTRTGSSSLLSMARPRRAITC